MNEQNYIFEKIQLILMDRKDIIKLFNSIKEKMKNDMMAYSRYSYFLVIHRVKDDYWFSKLADSKSPYIVIQKTEKNELFEEVFLLRMFRNIRKLFLPTAKSLPSKKRKTPRNL